MTFVREFGLVPNRGDAERFVRFVRWESRCVQYSDAEFEECTLYPVRVERTILDVSSGHGFSSQDWRLVTTGITELPLRNWGTVWPNDAPTESETLRRERIRALRRACHVDELKGRREPAWLPAEGAAEIVAVAAAVREAVQRAVA